MKSIVNRLTSDWYQPRFWLIALLSLTLAVSGCKKDEDILPESPPTTTNPSPTPTEPDPIDYDAIADPELHRYFDIEYMENANANLINVNPLPYEHFPTTPYAVDIARDMIYRQNEQGDFLSDMIADIGYPIWTRAVNYTDFGEKISLGIPFAYEDSENIQAMLHIDYRDGQYQFIFWTREQMLEYPNLEREIYFYNNVNFTLSFSSWTFGPDAELEEVLAALNPFTSSTGESERVAMNGEEPCFVQTTTWGYIPCPTLIYAKSSPPE